MYAKGHSRHIVEGLIEGETVEDLHKVQNLTLEGTISKCQALEAARQQHEELTHTPLGNILVHTVRRPAPQRPSNTATACPGCGSGPHHGGHENCPAYHVICHNCHRFGHFARVCRA